MQGTIFLSEEDKLILNVEQVADDYSKRTFKRNKEGGIFVLCPRGLYTLREYLTRRVAMYSAQKKLDDFRLKKLIIKRREEWYEIDMKKKEEEFNNMLLNSLVYYGIMSDYYDEDEELDEKEKEIALYENFVCHVYNGEYDRRAFCEGVDAAGSDNESAKAAMYSAAARKEYGEECDVVDIYEKAVENAEIRTRQVDCNVTSFDEYEAILVSEFHKATMDKVDIVNGRLDDVYDNVVSQDCLEETEAVLDSEAAMINSRLENQQRDKHLERFKYNILLPFGINAEAAISFNVLKGQLLMAKEKDKVVVNNDKEASNFMRSPISKDAILKEEVALERDW